MEYNFIYRGSDNIIFFLSQNHTKNKIDYNRNPQDKTLIYRKDESSFDMSPSKKNMDIRLVLNKLTFSVLDNMITQLSGFCGLPNEDDPTELLPIDISPQKE